MRQQSADAAVLLATVARGLNKIGATDFKCKEELQQALYFIALSNVHLRHFIDQIKDDESRTRMLARTNRIEELVEAAERKAAAL